MVFCHLFCHRLRLEAQIPPATRAVNSSDASEEKWPPKILQQPRAVQLFDSNSGFQYHWLLKSAIHGLNIVSYRSLDALACSFTVWVWLKNTNAKRNQRMVVFTKQQPCSTEMNENLKIFKISQPDNTPLVYPCRR